MNTGSPPSHAHPYPTHQVSQNTYVHPPYPGQPQPDLYTGQRIMGPPDCEGPPRAELVTTRGSEVDTSNSPEQPLRMEVTAVDLFDTYRRYSWLTTCIFASQWTGVRLLKCVAFLCSYPLASCFLALAFASSCRLPSFLGSPNNKVGSVPVWRAVRLPAP